MNVIVGQSGGPTAVINSSVAGVFEEAKRQGCEKVYAMINGITGILSGDIMILDEVLTNERRIRLLQQTPSAYLGSCRYMLPPWEDDPSDYRRIFHFLEEREIEAFFYIGGNDSMDTVDKLSAFAKKVGSPIRFVGIPKTVDNDLIKTDHTPGFGSAAKYVANVTREVVRDIESYNAKSVTMIEIMGRNAGWLTASSALAKTSYSNGPDLIYLPETPFTEAGFLEKIQKTLEKKSNLLVAISEGIRNEDGVYISELGDQILHKDSFGHFQLTGASIYLSDLLAHRLGIKTRAIELNTPQRCASHILSETDVEEAYQCGVEAVRAALRGETGCMVGMTRISDDPYEIRYETHSVDRIANEEHKFPLEWIDEENRQVTEDYIRYAKPLIQGELDLIYEDGVIAHLVRGKEDEEEKI